MKYYWKLCLIITEKFINEEENWIMSGFLQSEKWMQPLDTTSPLFFSNHTPPYRALQGNETFLSVNNDGNIDFQTCVLWSLPHPSCLPH